MPPCCCVLLSERSIRVCRASGQADGDLFIIVASDGVWEFIESQEACEVVAAESDATKACTKLVRLAAQRWQEEEGSYRDDITCVIGRLPFLDEDVDAKPEEKEEDGVVCLNKGRVGMAGLAPKPRPSEAARAEAEAKAAEAEAKSDEDFVARRLSMAQLTFDGDEDEEEEEDDDEPASPTK